MEIAEIFFKNPNCLTDFFRFFVISIICSEQKSLAKCHWPLRFGSTELSGLASLVPKLDYKRLFRFALMTTSSLVLFEGFFRLSGEMSLAFRFRSGFTGTVLFFLSFGLKFHCFLST